MKIGSNISALVAQRQLSSSTQSLLTAQQRLASGLRINCAADDAAGLSISTGLETDARVHQQAMRNLNDGISLLNIAEGAVAQLGTITIRQKELAEQAANGTLTLAQRRSLNAETNALIKEYNRIVQSINFNGMNLLDVQQGAGAVALQAGYGVNGAVSFALDSQLKREVGDGSFQSIRTQSGQAAEVGIVSSDIDGDGNLDLVASGYSGVCFLKGNGDGTFKARQVVSTNFAYELATGDFNRDGKIDLVTGGGNSYKTCIYLGNGNGTFQAALSYSTTTWTCEVAVSDLNNDGALDLAFGTFGGLAEVFLGAGDGTFKNSVVYTKSVSGRGMCVGDFNEDGRQDLLAFNELFIGNGDGSFRARTSVATAAGSYSRIGDVNGDGHLDIVAGGPYNSGSGFTVSLGNGDGTFRAARTNCVGADAYGIILSDFNDDGIIDVAASDAQQDKATIHFGNGDGTFKAGVSYLIGDAPQVVVAGDFDGDDVYDVATADYYGGTVSVCLQGNGYATTIAPADVLSASSAKTALTKLAKQLTRVTSELGLIGSSQSRLTTALSNLSSIDQNERAAFSQIVDVDVAEESSELLRQQIRQQIGSAILAQANQEPQLALEILSNAGPASSLFA